jgi:hypothetical protein
VQRHADFSFNPDYTSVTFGKVPYFQMESRSACNSSEFVRATVMIGVSPNWGVRVPSYRLYRLDGAGRIVSADWIAADADAEAIRYARERVPESHFELWERGRLVALSADEPR